MAISIQIKDRRYTGGRLSHPVFPSTNSTRTGKPGFTGCKTPIGGAAAAACGSAMPRGYNRVIVKERVSVAPGARIVMLRLCSSTSSSDVRVECPVQGSSAMNGASPTGDQTPM